MEGVFSHKGIKKIRVFLEKNNKKLKIQNSVSSVPLCEKKKTKIEHLYKLIAR